MYITEVLCLSLWVLDTFVVLRQLASVPEWVEVSSKKSDIISLLCVCLCVCGGRWKPAIEVEDCLFLQA